MPDISKRLDKAEKYLQRGKPEAALEEYLSILQDEPRNEQVRQTAADLCLALGRGTEAASLLSPMFEQEVEIGDIAKGIVTYKKLAKISVPTPLQTFHYAQLVERKDKHEALAAYESALAGFEKQRKNAQVLAAAQRIVELSPTAENYQRAGEKAALMGEGRAAAANFVQLGQLRDEASPGSGFQWYERAYNLDPMNLQAVFLYSRGLFVRNHLPECIDVLTPVVTRFQSTPEVRELYAHAMMAAHRPAEAEPHSWELFVRDPQQLEEIASLVGVYLDVGDTPGALALAGKIEDHESRAGRRREFLTAMFEMSDRRQASLQFTEYLEKLFANAGREHEYSRILLKLFQLYSDAGRFREAAETLDRAAELDPYESGHAKRLETLRGRICRIPRSEPG
jgi:tetratricopeptide (TPR) repeat protein